MYSKIDSELMSAMANSQDSNATLYIRTLRRKMMLRMQSTFWKHSKTPVA